MQCKLMAKATESELSRWQSHFRPHTPHTHTHTHTHTHEHTQANTELQTARVRADVIDNDARTAANITRAQAEARYKSLAYLGGWELSVLRCQSILSRACKCVDALSISHTEVEYEAVQERALDPS